MYRLITNDKLYLVPYNGGPAAATSLIRKETQLYFSDLTSVSPYIASGQFRALAVTSAARVKEHPTIPTTAEARSEEHTSELQPLMRTSYALCCLQKKRSHRHKQ